MKTYHNGKEVVILDDEQQWAANERALRGAMSVVDDLTHGELDAIVEQDRAAYWEMQSRRRAPRRQG